MLHNLEEGNNSEKRVRKITTKELNEAQCFIPSPQTPKCDQAVVHMPKLYTMFQDFLQDIIKSLVYLKLNHGPQACLRL